jgi:hypothetical protein
MRLSGRKSWRRQGIVPGCAGPRCRCRTLSRRCCRIAADPSARRRSCARGCVVSWGDPDLGCAEASLVLGDRIDDRGTEGCEPRAHAICRVVGSQQRSGGGVETSGVRPPGRYQGCDERNKDAQCANDGNNKRCPKPGQALRHLSRFHLRNEQAAEVLLRLQPPPPSG